MAKQPTNALDTGFGDEVSEQIESRAEACDHLATIKLHELKQRKVKTIDYFLNLQNQHKLNYFLICTKYRTRSSPLCPWQGKAMWEPFEVKGIKNAEKLLCIFVKEFEKESFSFCFPRKNLELFLNSSLLQASGKIKKRERENFPHPLLYNWRVILFN